MAPPHLPEADALRWERRARELLQRIAVETSRARDLREALGAVLRAVCAHTGWPVGHVFELDASGQRLVSARLWHLEDPAAYEAFRRISEDFVFTPGVGMPGRVLASGRPLWIMDVTRDPNFPRAKLASDVGVRAGFGFPVMAEERVVAVLEFFAPRAAEPDEPLLEVMASLGFQLGHLHERMRAEARLLASELRFRSVAESATDAVVTVDVLGRVVSWNPAASRLFGWSEAEMVGELLERVIPEPYRAGHRAGMARMASGGEPRVVGKTVELSGLRKDGTTFPLELSLGMWASSEGRFYTGVLRDITRRKEAERQLREQAERLDRQNEELATKNLELVRQREDLLESWRQMEQIFSAFADALPGQELDGYHLEAKIGSGGYGVVYRATEVATGARVAVKVFRPANGRLSPDHVARFRREGATATRVNHPNAVRVLDAGVSSAGIPFLVMEYLEGRTLAERLRSDGPLPAVEAVQIAAAVAGALAAAHAAGIVHRDLKPDNVFCAPDGPKLLDFGIARLLDETGDGAFDAITQTGQMVGTPAYMAPERLQGVAYDGRADVYSLGVLLYETLSGARPFDAPGRTPWEIIRQHLTQPVAPLAEVVPGVPDALERIVRGALAREADARPTARQVADALLALPAELLERVPLPPRRPWPHTRTGTPAPIAAAPTVDFEAE